MASCPVWDYDDLSLCWRHRLAVYPAAAVGAASAAVLVVKSVQMARRHRIVLDGDDSLAATHTQTEANEPVTNSSASAGAKLRHQHYSLDQLGQVDHEITKLVFKGVGDTVRVALEFLLVATIVTCNALALWNRHVKVDQTTLQVNLAVWSYLFLIVSLRVINMRRVRIRLPSLWVHSTTAYLLLFPFQLVLMRSSFLHKMNHYTRWYWQVTAVAQFVLFCLNFSAKVGDKPSLVYVPDDGTTPSPEPVSSLFSLMSYSWIDPMVWLSTKHTLQKSEIWALRGDDYALPTLKQFNELPEKWRFPTKLVYYFKGLLLVQAMWAALEGVLIFIPSLLLKRILEYVDNPEQNSRQLAWTFVLLMPICKIIDSTSSGCSLFIGRRVCLRMKSIIIGEVYAKALRRRVASAETEDAPPNENDDVKQVLEKEKKDSEKSADLGAIINLMAIDAFKVSEICGYLHFFVGSIFMIIICIWLLYGLIGWPALVGSLMIILLLPVSYKMATWGANLQKKMLSVTDQRIQKLNETFQSIRIIKFFAWEDKFADQVMDIRRNELYYLKLRTIAWCIGSLVWFVTPTLVTLVSFYCYTVVAGNPLTAPVAFTALSLFTLLRTPLDQLSDMTAFVIQSKVSLDRVDDFLREPESTKYDQLSQSRGPDSPEIGFEQASFSWNVNNHNNDFKLRDLDVSFKVGQLNVVIGATGSGKTSLLLALLGEMDLIQGKVFLPGAKARHLCEIDPATGLTESVAYCSQLPWLLNDTIKNNIIFAAPFNQKRYNDVIEACGLKRDLEILSAGDATEIGEKGITLSGGQKQRVSLARALYSNSKTLLLDDCLSAVDSHTALWIYENCITGPLMANRTCILVSHNVALTVAEAAWVVALDNGRVKAQGTPSDLLTSGDLGDDELVKSSVISSQSGSRTASHVDLKQMTKDDLTAKAEAIENKLKKLASQDQPVTEAAEAEAEATALQAEAEADGKLVEEEFKAEGVVGVDVYLGFAKYLGGFWTWFSILGCFVLAQGLFMTQSWWLRVWSMNSERAARGEFGMAGYAMVVVADFMRTTQSWKDNHSTIYYITVYGLLGFIYAFMASLRVFVTFFAGIKASNRMFREVLQRILRANLRFFDKTPIGRIMNRFSKDMESVDQEVTPFAEGVFNCVVQCLSIFVLIIVITPGFFIFAILISVIYYLVGYFYITLSRELKRFESITKSPIHQHFSETLVGVSTIRAYGVEPRFMVQNLEAIDENNKPFFYLWVDNRWLSFRVDAVGSLVMLFSGIFVMLSVGKMDAGLAGLSLSYAIAFSDSALWIVRMYANLEMNMNSVERLQEYMDVDQEPPYEIEETKPPASWPQQGRIDVNNVSLRYAPHLPQVIKNVSFSVEPFNKVGIVGRTGAGKSTIITAFFRFLDPESGSIAIDGVDISTIGLKDLRKAITIIPQDPTLFTGTIRSNLDPFDQYTDDQMFEALRRVNLIAPEEQLLVGSSSRGASPSPEENQNKFLRLDNPIAEGGSNLSQGERQLVCLARSLLKNPKVMLLDEATSSIDYQSDAMIQNTIREEFGQSTILTIAHRLRTIIDYDKILVMDQGKVVEYENPYVLITNHNSLFYSMCENSGELDSLVKLAKEAYTKKLNRTS
ncbi:hypothetical protein DIURU_001603 [Diutina rugosa]|uniref:ATP-dependent bile acid permease n=1 Tax=Diutina rugosa TaxID=5481 RepID=A0A642UTQ9_DIURU|nr:uncharacterized protein DIURU_001603 [Diutina rugosa]KAA8905175.1 hypothetical protein DIURU_001603 [Diutina rugosa]